MRANCFMWPLNEGRVNTFNTGGKNACAGLIENL